MILTYCKLLFKQQNCHRKKGNNSLNKGMQKTLFYFINSVFFVFLHFFFCLVLLRIKNISKTWPTTSAKRKKMGNRLKYLRHGVPQYSPLTSFSNTHLFCVWFFLFFISKDTKNQHRRHSLTDWLLIFFLLPLLKIVKLICIRRLYKNVNWCMPYYSKWSMY